MTTKRKQTALRSIQNPSRDEPVMAVQRARATNERNKKKNTYFSIILNCRIDWISCFTLTTTERNRTSAFCAFQEKLQTTLPYDLLLLLREMPRRDGLRAFPHIVTPLTCTKIEVIWFCAGTTLTQLGNSHGRGNWVFFFIWIQLGFTNEAIFHH